MAASALDSNMENGPRGFRLDGVARHPPNALVEHPELLLVIGAFGIGVTLFSSQLCAGLIHSIRCAGALELLGLGIAGVGVIPYVIVRIQRPLREKN